MTRQFAIIGAGKVGTALGYSLSRRGYQLTAIASRTLASTQKAHRLIGQGKPFDDIITAAQSARLVFITTPDRAIESTCNRIASHNGFQPEAVVIHCSGALPSSILESARTCGAHIASLHPIQSIASVEQAIKLLPGSYFGFEGDEAASMVARQLVDTLGGKWLAISTEDKPLYHAAAVFACNYVVTLLDVGTQLLEAAGIAEQDALTALLSLLKGTADNLACLGLPQALTGPIARGDKTIVARHLQGLKQRLPKLIKLYCQLGERTVKIGQDKKGLSATAAGELRRLFEQWEKETGD
jgi:predicted short-subunit dehydrogenase-like oxidoreductase (DUF2520 family)